MDTHTPNVLSIYHERIKNFCKEDNWEKAHHLADTTIKTARESYKLDPMSLSELVQSLEIKGDIYRQTGEFEKAGQLYAEALELLQKDPTLIEDIARISASQAVLSESLDDMTAAIQFYEQSIEHFEKLSPPAVLDIADLCNNLAFLYRDNGNNNKAQALLMKALNICHKQLGMEHEETALICNNLGALHTHAQQHEQAREMHKIALEGRIATLGEKHLDTAQSYANLAVAEAKLQKTAEAKKLFEKALDIFEPQVSQAPSDYATITANYIEYLKSLGEEKAAIALEKKSAKKIKHLA